MTALPDPFTELRMTALHATRGANYWSRRPVTRMDVRVGAYDDISSADVPGFTDALRAAMPGLDEHKCSIGEPGGFVTRLRRGTYAPHIVEHVALELQCMIGHDVSYGKARGGDIEGEYTLIFEHRHEGVGLRAAGLALDVVQRAFGGTLQSVDQAVAELEAIARNPDAPSVRPQVRCAITGGAGRNAVRDEILRRGAGAGGPIIDVAPAYILQQGLPFAHCDVGIILDAELTDVPERYREQERARQLVCVLADAVRRGGMVIVPAHEWAIQEYARDGGCLVSVFDRRGDASRRDTQLAQRVAAVDAGRIVVDDAGERTDYGSLREDTPAAAQLAAALAQLALVNEPSSVAGLMARSRSRRSDEAEGTLVLMGGAVTAEGEALGTFLRLCDAERGGRIIALTTASSAPVRAARAWLADLKRAGAINVEVPIVDRRSRAQDDSIATVIGEADGIFLGGGDQVHLVATLSGSKVGDAIIEAYRAGAIVGGTSAGAAALTETILAGGEPDEHGQPLDMYIGPGLALLGFHAMIDTHFAERRRLHRLFKAIAANPQLMGLGIDEDTALVVSGHRGAVVGVGGVTFVDGRGIRFDNAKEVAPGGSLTLSALRVGLIGNGHVFNLRERELEALVRERERSGEVTPTVGGRTVD